MHYHTSSIPSLVFSMNFDRYYRQIDRMTYISEKKRKSFKLPFVIVNGAPIKPSFKIDLNIKKLFHPIEPFLNTETNTCTAISSCPNASICSKENFPVICNENFIYDPNTTPNPTCSTECSGRSGRGAMSDKTRAFCNKKCDEKMQRCGSEDPIRTQNLSVNNVCPAGFDRYGYKCIEQSVSKQSKIFFGFFFLIIIFFSFFYSLIYFFLHIRFIH